MNTYEELIIEVEENVEAFYQDLNIEPEDIPRLAVEDVLYGIALPETAVNQYWDKLTGAAVQKYEQLSEFGRF